MQFYGLKRGKGKGNFILSHDRREWLPNLRSLYCITAIPLEDIVQLCFYVDCGYDSTNIIPLRSCLKILTFPAGAGNSIQYNMVSCTL